MEITKTMKFNWWPAEDLCAEVNPNHAEELTERGFAHITEMAQEGYSSGQLVHNVCMAGDPEDGTDYLGFWTFG